MSELTLKRLEYFLSVADEGNVTRAARRLHVSQPALSLQLKLLEGAVGKQLMTRTSRGVILTSAGSALRDEAEIVLNQTHQLLKNVTTAGEVGRGTLVLGASPVSCEHFIPFVLQRFRRRFPGIDVSLIDGDAGTLSEMLQAKTIDIAITRQRHEVLMRAREDDLKTTVLLNEELILALPPSSRLADQACLKLSDLAESRLIMYARRRGARYFDALVTACRDRGGFDPTDIVEAESIGAQIALIAAGYGLGFVTNLSALRSCEDVVFKPCEDLEVSTPTVMIARMDKSTVRSFAEVIGDATNEFIEQFGAQIFGRMENAG